MVHVPDEGGSAPFADRYSVALWTQGLRIYWLRHQSLIAKAHKRSASSSERWGILEFTTRSR